MKRLPSLVGCLAVLAATCLMPAVRAQPALSPNANEPGVSSVEIPKDDDSSDGVLAPAMQRLTATQRQMARLMRQANESLKSGSAPGDVAKKFYAALARIEGLQSPMVALNDLKTRLTNLGLADATLGEKFPLGGTPVERSLLVYRRHLTMDCIRAAVTEVSARFGAESTGKVFLAKIGKWAVQNPDMFMLAGDIDFSFMGARPEVILALRDAFAATIKQRSGGLHMVAIDSVATAHGFAEHLVYMGIQGRKFADDAMMGMDTGIEQIDFHNPDSVGTAQARQITGKQALTETVLEETARAYREQGLEEKGRTLANETEKAWNDRRSQTVEPMLSMEMARHLEHDIIRNIDVFTALDIVKKGSKYLRRSNDQITTDLKIDSASPDWAKVVEQVDEKAKKASAEEISTFIHEELTKLGMPALFELKVENGKARLEATPDGAEKFLATVKEQIWKNVSSGLDLRIRTMTDALNLRGRAAGPGTPDDLRPERIQDTIRMLAAGLEAMQHDHSLIPADIVTKVSVLTKIVETHARQRAFTLPEEELKKIREVLREATANENSLLLKTAACADHIDKWMTKNYDVLAAKLPESMRSGLSVADAKIDALNNFLGALDEGTVSAMRERGIIKLPVPVGLSEDGQVQFLKVTEFPSIGAINARLNQSIVGKIGNSTAFKAFNLAQEGDAYYNALAQAATPSEAFQNLATEIFRRRVPGGGAVEALVMENYVRASVEVVYLIFPPSAIPEGIYGIAASVKDKYNNWWWSSELERYVDTFYAGAEFERIEPTNPSDKPRYRLTALTIKHPGCVATYERSVLEFGTANFLQNPDVDKTLWANIAVADPFIQLMEELKKHEAAGAKVRAHFQQQLDDHWAKVKADFGKSLIERFENRKASELAIDLGEVPGLYGELVKIADDLEIKDGLHASMDKEWDSNYLQRLWVWLKADKRAFWNEAPPEAEKTRAVTILRKYLDAYRKVLAGRTETEAALEKIFSDVQLAPPPHERDGRRVLTRMVFLRCSPEQDAGLAARLQVTPDATLEKVKAQLDAIIEAKAPGAKRDEKFDREIAAHITSEVFWIAALRTTQVPVIGAGALERAIAAHSAESDKCFAEFTEHYVNQTGALAVRVRQWIDDAASEQPVTGATLALANNAGTSAGAPFREVGAGVYQALGVKEGSYTLTVSAPGFVARSGGAMESVSVAAGSDKSSREVDVYLKALGDAKDLRVAIASSIEPALIFTRGETTSVELRATVVAKKGSGKLTYQWTLGDEVLLTGPGESKVTFSASGRKPGDAKISLFVVDEMKREGTAETTVRIVDGEPLKVVFGEHRAEVFKNDQETLCVVEPKPGPGLGFTYQWVFKNAAGKQVFAQGGADLDRQLVAGQNYVGEKLAVTMAVRDRDGRTGSAATAITVRDEEKPEALPVTIAPASGTMKVGDKLTLRAAAQPFPDSEAIEYSWDDGKTWSTERSSAEITALENEVGVLQSITVLARDKRGHSGEATAGIRVEKADAPSKADVSGLNSGDLRITIDGPREAQRGQAVTLTAKIEGISEAQRAQLIQRWKVPGMDTTLADGPTISVPLDHEGSGTHYVTFAVYRKDRYGDLDQLAGESVGILQLDTGKPALSISAPTFIALGQKGWVTAQLLTSIPTANLRWKWTPDAGNKSSFEYTPKTAGENEIKLEVLVVVAGKEEPLASASCKIVAAANELELPAQVMATDIFTVTPSLPPALAGLVKGFSWITPAGLLDPTTGKWTSWSGPSTQADATLQVPAGYYDFGHEAPKEPLEVSLRLIDADGHELHVLTGKLAVQPARFAGSLSGAWEGDSWPGGFWGKRKPTLNASRVDENGKSYNSANASADLEAKWDTFGADPEEDFRQDATTRKWEISGFTIGDFKGFIAIEPGVQWWRGSGGWMTGYTGSSASRSAFGFVKKGGAVIRLKFHAGSGGSWDNSDKDWQMAKVEALFAEARGILAGLKIAPDGKLSKTPYTGPALDGSDEVLPLTVALDGPPGGKLGFGQSANVAAKVNGGKAPYVYTWNGDHGGSGASVTIIPTSPGEHSLSVNVKSADGQSADASINYTVDQITATIGGLEPPVIYGTTRTITLNVTGANGVRALWQSTPNLTFNPPESPDGKATVRIDRAPTGGVKVWAQLTNAAGKTLGEATQITVDVKPPAFSFKIADPAPKVGREVGVKIVTTPEVPAALLDFRWIDPGTAQRREITDNASEVAVTPRDAKPLALVVQARVPGSGDDLGEFRDEIKPAAFKLKAWVVEPGNRPMIWREGVGLVPVERGSYAGDELVVVAADFDGDKPEGDVRWTWTANEGTAVSAPTSRTPNASRHEAGTASLSVTASDKDNVALGTASVSFSVNVTAEAVRQALQPVVTLRADKTAPVTGEPLVFTADVSRGTVPYRYWWTGAPSNAATATLTPTKPGKITVSVTVTDAKGKTASGSLEREVRLSDRDRARQEAERLAGVARDAARRGDFDAAAKAIGDARRADPSIPESVKTATREVGDAAEKAAQAADAKRDFATSGKLYGIAAQLDPQDADAARGVTNAQAAQRKLNDLRAGQQELEGTLAKRDLDAATNQLAKVKASEASLPGTTSAETTALAAKLQQATAEYTRDVANQKQVINADQGAKRYTEARTKLNALTQQRPLRRDDAAWAKTLLADLDRLIAADAAKKSDRKTGNDDTGSSSETGSSSTDAGTPNGTTGKSTVAPGTGDSSTAKPVAPTLTGAPAFTGELGTKWDKLQAVGGNFDAFARLGGGALVVDVPAGNSWGKTGVMSHEPALKVGTQPISVIVRLDPARTTGVCVAFAASPHPDVYVLQNVWMSWVRTPAAVQADFWFGNTQNGNDGHLTEQIAPAAPAELVFTFQPGRASVLLPDGKTRSINIGWLKEGTPLFTHVFSHPTDAGRPAKFALTGLEVATGIQTPSATPAPAATTQGAGIPVGGLGEVWDKLQAVGGNFDKFARFDRGALVVDVPAGNYWGKTGVLSHERIFSLGTEPMNVTVRLDSSRTTGVCVAFASSPHPDVYVLQNVWFSWTRTSAAAQAGIWFGNTQNGNDGHVDELLAPAPPAELTFTLQPGRASVRLPDGKTRTIAIDWLKPGTPIFAHVFSHPADSQRPAKFAMTQFSVTAGAPPAALSAPIPLSGAATNVPVGALDDIWDKLQSVGGNFDAFARFEGSALVVNVPAGNSWGKTGIMSHERLFTLGKTPVSVAVKIDPARTTGFCLAFASSPHPDVYVLQNAWLSWTVPLDAKQADLNLVNTQNGGDGHASDKLGLTAPAELVFTLQPGRIDVHLPGGKTYSIALGWMKEETPIFGHFFTHPAAAGLQAKLALKGVTVSFGTPAASTPTVSTSPVPPTPISVFTPRPVPKPALPPVSKPLPAAKPGVIFTNWNTGGVGVGPAAPTTFKIGKPARITYFNSYHHNYGRGTKAGALALRHSDGTVYGPWSVKGSTASGAPNGLWEIEPGVVLKPGTYTVVDSDPATWSNNGQSGNCGFAEVRGVWTDTILPPSTSAAPVPAASKPVATPAPVVIKPATAKAPAAVVAKPVPIAAKPAPVQAVPTLAPLKPAPIRRAVMVEVVFENRGTQNVHIFVDGRDNFGPQNRLTPGQKRTVSVELSADGRLKFVAGRNGQVLARSSWDGDPSDLSRYPVVRFAEDGSPALLVTTGLK